MCKLSFRYSLYHHAYTPLFHLLFSCKPSHKVRCNSHSRSGEMPGPREIHSALTEGKENCVRGKTRNKRGAKDLEKCGRHHDNNQLRKTEDAMFLLDCQQTGQMSVQLLMTVSAAIV